MLLKKKLDHQYPELKPFYCHFFFFVNPGLWYEWTESIESRMVSCYLPYLNHYIHRVVLVYWNKFKILKGFKDTYISQADVTYIYLAFTSKNTFNVHCIIFCCNVSGPEHCNWRMCSCFGFAVETEGCSEKQKQLEPLYWVVQRFWHIALTLWVYKNTSSGKKFHYY